MVDFYPIPSTRKNLIGNAVAAGVAEDAVVAAGAAGGGNVGSKAEGVEHLRRGRRHDLADLPETLRVASRAIRAADLRAPVLLSYQQAVHGNFSVALIWWLWQRLLPGMWDDDGVVFVGIGTLIDRAIPDARLRVIFGSGAGYAAPPQGVAESDGGWRVYGVRGPLTARVLGLHPSLALTDTAILLSQLAEFKDHKS